jgi:hypothetical protein
MGQQLRAPLPHQVPDGGYWRQQQEQQFVQQFPQQSGQQPVLSSLNDDIMMRKINDLVSELGDCNRALNERLMANVQEANAVLGDFRTNMSNLITGLAGGINNAIQFSLASSTAWIDLMAPRMHECVQHAALTNVWLQDSLTAIDTKLNPR